MGREMHKEAWGWTAAVCAVGALSAVACLRLTPIRAIEMVALKPAEAAGDYRVDPVDTSLVFVKEGLRVKVRHLTEGELNAEVPSADNPFTYRNQVDMELGYVPVRFTVFQVTVSNPTFDKVLLQPEHAVLVTGRGGVLRPYMLTRAEAGGDVHNFETYWLSRGVQSGNAQKLYLERMSILRGMVYHKDAFVYKGKSYSGKLVFDPLPRGTSQLELRLNDFVLEFGLYDVPETVVDLSYPFQVERGVVDPVERGKEGESDTLAAAGPGILRSAEQPERR